MSLTSLSSGQLGADVRLSHAVSEFEADLTSEQKLTFRKQCSEALEHPPKTSDIIHLMASIDSDASRPQNGLQARCVGPRLANVLEAIQQYASLGETIVGESHNLIACEVWALVETSLMVRTTHI
jgi:hypothetical protein